ncbi:unnamed protein product [Rodentolepis nana]|uniref:NAC domain-containing protein n=1 Tax=Rodentolepis nana TaxID=102285 RepID=A0A0R3TI08_RODNA|nr:unnamed protein product [Rodentolepis nana]
MSQCVRITDLAFALSLSLCKVLISIFDAFFSLHFSDEDMISLASSMSLTYAPSSAYGMMGSSRFGSDSPIPEAANSPTDDFTSITNQLQALERCPDPPEVNAKNEKDELPFGNMNETKVQCHKYSQFSFGNYLSSPSGLFIYISLPNFGVIKLQPFGPTADCDRIRAVPASVEYKMRPQIFGRIFGKPLTLYWHHAIYISLLVQVLCLCYVRKMKLCRR